MDELALQYFKNFRYSFFLKFFFFNQCSTRKIMFSHKLFFSFRKTRHINKASLPIRGCCTALAQWRSTAVRAHFHLGPACLSAIPSLMVIFNLFLPRLGQMEHALKHVFGVKLHSWLAFLASGMRAVRRHQGDSSQEDILSHHCLGLFCED